MADSVAISRFEQLRKWLQQNGIAPESVPIDADIVTGSDPDGAAWLRCEIYLRNRDGDILLNDSATGPAIITTVVPLVAPPPEWFQPRIKPNRERFVQAVAAVSKLHVRNANTGTCEHCSERDYPDYAVPWPCPTIQALGDLPSRLDQPLVPAPREA